MLEKLDDARKVVGTRRLLKALAAGEIEKAYLADDADMFIRTQVQQACSEAGRKAHRRRKDGGFGQGMRRGRENRGRRP